MNELHPSLDRWSEWFDGLGSAAGRAELERHLAACTECRGQVDTFKRLREDLQGLQVKTAPSYLRRQIMDAAREREIRQSTSFGRS